MKADFDTPRGGLLLDLVDDSTVTVGVGEMYAVDLQALVLQYF